MLNTPHPVKISIQYTRTGRYYKLNTVSKETKNVWIVFHGYGQLAEYFIKHFEELDPKENFIIAPEGLSRFYIDGLSGRVGASWMTKDDRESEILDQSKYINSVMKNEGVDSSNENYRIIVLGFSQGTATAVRWMANNRIRPSQLILWAGSFPHDIDPKVDESIFSALPVHFAYGDEDPFLKNIDINDKRLEFELMGITLRIWPFEGKHVMDKPTLTKIVDSFDN